MDKADEERIKRLYGCEDKIASYMIPLGMSIQYVDRSELKDIKRQLEHKRRQTST